MKKFDKLQVRVLSHNSNAAARYSGGDRKTNWLKRFIIEKQNYLEKRCVSIWDFTNWKEDNCYIFGKFKDDETGDETIVTLAYRHKRIGWLPAR